MWDQEGVKSNENLAAFKSPKISYEFDTIVFKFPILTKLSWPINVERIEIKIKIKIKLNPLIRNPMMNSSSVHGTHNLEALSFGFGS